MLVMVPDPVSARAGLSVRVNQGVTVSNISCGIKNIYYGKVTGIPGERGLPLGLLGVVLSG